MVNSQEVRLPFLDKKLIDFTNNIKPELGDNHRELKYLLKETLKNYVPKDIPLKQKQGFSINIDELLKTDIKQDVLDLLLSKNSFLTTILIVKLLNVGSWNFTLENHQTHGHYGLCIPYINFLKFT